MLMGSSYIISLGYLSGKLSILCGMISLHFRFWFYSYAFDPAS